MPGGLTLLASLNADIPTPASGKATIFFSLDSGVPSYKNDAGTVLPLGTTGATGPTGATGAAGQPIYLMESANEVDAPMIPGAQGATGASGGGAAPKSTSLLTSGTGATYNVPAGITAIIVEVVGAGGGGGGAARGSSMIGVGSGGGGGSYSRKVYTVTPAQAFVYTIGTGGPGGTAGNNNGTAGGDSTFDNSGSIVTAQGGTGGTGMAAGNTVTLNNGGIGQGASGGNLNTRAGTRAPACIRLNATLYVGNPGGNSIYGAGGGFPGDATGNVGLVYGGGGSGGGALSATDRAGGAGADGVIIITEFGT